MTKKGEKVLEKKKMVEGFCCFVQRLRKMVKVTFGYSLGEVGEDFFVFVFWQRLEKVVEVTLPNDLTLY